MALDATVHLRTTEEQKDELMRLGDGNISRGFQALYKMYEQGMTRRAPPPPVARVAPPPPAPAAPALKPQRYIPPPRGYVGKR